MNLELLKKISAIIAAYKGSTDEMIAAIKKVFERFIGENGINANAMYKPEYIRETIKKEMDAALEENKKLNKLYNQQIKNIIEGAKKQMLPVLNKQVQKPADYAMKINNALQLLAIEGDGITDESAFDILKDFMEDNDQMRIFKRVIGKHVELETSTGGTLFPKTFGKLNQVESILNTLAEMEAIAENIFLHKKQSGQTYTINSVQYILPMDGYGETTDELAIVDYATIIDNIASKDECIQDVATEPESGE
jgi:uncharacterized protein (DUF952 family)